MADSKWGEGRLPPSKNSDLQKCGNDSLVVIYALAFTRVSPPLSPPMIYENSIYFRLFWHVNERSHVLLYVKKGSRRKDFKAMGL